MNEMSTISAWVTDRFSRAELFEILNIDFCCGGNKTLKEACEEKNLSTDDVLRKLEQWDRSCSTTDCNHMEADELCNHIEKTHHAYLKRMLPLVHAHLEKIVNAHGEKYSELKKTFESFIREIDSHMKEEEELVFPAIRSQKPQTHEFFSKLEDEHRLAGDLLASIRNLTDNFTPPLRHA
jgi:Regulator of cell morphogenesis and NO signaling